MTDAQQQYTPKVGDRVRVTRTLEGKVTDAERGHWMSPHFMLEVDGAGYHEIHDEDNWEIEKLQDPEPEWVNGDVVRLTILDPQSPYATFVRTEGRGWQGPLQTAILDAKLSAYWRDGKLDILYKTDAYDGDYLS